MACGRQLPDMVQLFLDHFGPDIMDAVVPNMTLSVWLLRVLQLGQGRKEFADLLLAKRATSGGRTFH
jgi:hypothetical protein